ncbi:MAG: 2-oxoglutarate dehydrogenase E1 component, partial [Acidobacteriaceae bacterium]|nr:2-oxoglutarate dehydrogenase E1 component [Acidobacteriaceae bacterium]
MPTETAQSLDREQIFDAFRRWGYLEADLDPLGFLNLAESPDLRFDGPDADDARRIYCGTIGVEFMHLTSPEQRDWIRERMEASSSPRQRGPSSDGFAPQRILDRLVRADVFEQVLQSRYLGSKRFSLEGVTALIPLLDEMLEAAAENGIEQAVIGMSHRGRLNVMLHIVNRPAVEVFAGFEDVDPRSVLGGGDVKYHVGATGEYRARNGHTVDIHLVSNPSHLEAVDPVVIGRTRAKQTRAGK